MVDKGTARMLVYGALATLALILLVAIYAMATKGSVQSELERKLDLLAKKEADLHAKERAREEAENRYRDAQSHFDEERALRKQVETQKDRYKDEYDDVFKEKSDYASESERLRRKLWDKDDQAELEKLESKSEEELMRELEEEGKEFFGETHDLADEKLDGEDQKDLEKELKAAKRYEDQYQDLEKKLHDSDEGNDEAALEGLQELGEQNEVFLDELARDAKRNTNKKWRKPDRAEHMGKLAKEMDLHAEALRNKRHEKALETDDHDLDELEARAGKDELDDDDHEFAPVVKDIAKELEGDEERLLRELHQADEPEEFDAAKHLEEDAEQDELKLARLEQLAEDSSKLTPAQKAEREKLIKDLEKEAEDVEDEAQGIEKGLERRHVRHDAVKMAKAVNRLNNQDLKNLKHGKKAIGDVEQIIGSESEMLDSMKKGDVSGEERYGRELAEEAEGLEDDAEHLFDEADAGDFDDLDEKLLDEQLAKELEDAGDEMEHDAGGVEHDDHARGVREAGEEIQENAERFGDAEKDFGKVRDVKRDAQHLEDEAEQLGRAVGEQAWEEEAGLARKALHDVDALDNEADDLEKEIRGADEGKISPEDLKEDEDAVQKIRAAGAKLKKEAQGVLDDVGYKAQHKQEKLSEQLADAQKAAKEAHDQ